MSERLREAAAALLATCAALLSACGDQSVPGPRAGSSITSSGPGGAGGGPPVVFSLTELEGTQTLVEPTELRFIPGTDELLIAGKPGRVEHYRLRDGELELLGTFSNDKVYAVQDCGLVSLALAPDFATTHHLYLGYCVDSFSSRVVRVTFDPRNYADIWASATEILVEGDPKASHPWHNVGALNFDAEGNLFVQLGDKTVKPNAQDPASNLGKLLRIRPKSDGIGYDPAPSNPFVGVRGKSADVYVSGLRSPWRGVVDAKGRYWIGDVGDASVEEVDLIVSGGQNFGWPDIEGSNQVPGGARCPECIEPLTTWPHDSSSVYVAEDPDAVPSGQRVAWVGCHLEPGAQPDPYAGALDDATLFGDFAVGFIRVVQVDGRGKLVTDRHLGHLYRPTGCDRGPDGHVYLTSFGSRIVSKEPPVAAKVVRLDSK